MFSECVYIFLANSDCSLRKTVKSNTNLTRTVSEHCLVVVGKYEFIRETIDCQFTVGNREISGSRDASELHQRGFDKAK